MTHIQQRDDTAAAWTAANPVLHKGEVGWESDTNKAKKGDGVTAWNALPYAVVAPSSVTKANVGLGNVDNTSDVNKPVSSATQAALNLKAPLASPTFTGDPKAPTPVTTDSDTSIATTAFVKAALLAAHPVGDIKMTTVNVNPSTYLGGTWVAWGSGRVPVGVDTAQTEFDTVEETGGFKTHTLLQTELPSHQHAAGTLTADSAGSHSHTPASSANQFLINDPGGTANRANGTGFNALGQGSTAAAGAHTHSISGSTALNGGGQPHNNLQPYITCYMWKRTA